METSEIDKLSLSLLENISSLKERNCVPELRHYLHKNPRIKVLRGLRGVGKTTILLQLLKTMKATGIYFSSDWPTIASEGIYAVGKRFVESGRTHIFVDEVHKYPGWEKELKALHDQFPGLQIFCSGSAAVAFTPDRRYKLFDIEPMCFGEFLRIRYDTTLSAKEDLWKDERGSIELVAMHYPKIEEQFKEYMATGGFPASLKLEQNDALLSIYYSIRTSIREDSVSFLKLSNEKVFAMERLLFLLATSKPGELSLTSLSNNLGISKTTVYEIVDGISRMKIMRVIRPFGKGPKLVRGESKLLFVHPNLRQAVCSMLKKDCEIGALREEGALFGLECNGWSFYTIKGIKSNPDYSIEKQGKTHVIEIGGPSKNMRQLKGFDNAIVIKEEQLKVLLL